MRHSQSTSQNILWLPHIQRFVYTLYSHSVHRRIYNTLDREEMTETKRLDAEGSVEFVLPSPLTL